MKHISFYFTLFVFLLCILCLTPICDALRVEITEVSPTWVPRASTPTDLSIASVTVTISGITS